MLFLLSLALTRDTLLIASAFCDIGSWPELAFTSLIGCSVYVYMSSEHGWQDTYPDCVNRTFHFAESEMPRHTMHSDGLPAKAEVLGLVIVEKIAIACHPHISGNEDTDGIVYLPGLKVMVQQKKHLQPIMQVICQSRE